MVDRIVSADSHMLVLDEHALAHLAPEHHEAYLGLRGAHRRPGVSASDPPPPPVASGAPRGRGTTRRVGSEGTPRRHGPRRSRRGGHLHRPHRAARRSTNCPPKSALPRCARSTPLRFEFAAVDASRLLPVYLLPLHDIDGAVAELRRIVDEGGRAVQVPLYPADADLAPYWDERYEPLWSALEETGVPLSLHVCPPEGARWARTRRPHAASSR